MASKATGGFVLLGLGALLIAAVAGADEKKEPKPQPEPKPEPKPEPGKKCVRTQPGDGPGNGKEAAVRAWQQCLIDSGCLTPDGLDGRHDVITEGASKLYEANNGKCDAPYQLPKKGGGGAATKNTTYRLVALTAPGGNPKSTQLGSTELANPVKKSDEKQVLSAFAGQADNYFGQSDEPGEAFVFKNDGKGDKQIWARTYNQKGLPPGNVGSDVGGVIA